MDFCSYLYYVTMILINIVNVGHDLDIWKKKKKKAFAIIKFFFFLNILFWSNI